VEFIIPDISLRQLAFIFPLLGHLSYNEDPRWLTCIGSLLLSKKDCRQFGLNRYRLLQVLPSQRCDVVDIAERALAAGKSHTVFCQTAALSEQDLVRLEQAATRGQARGVIARSR
jgi:cell division inhibitor SulA